MNTTGRIALELLISRLRSLWNYWELRTLLLLSVTLQIILILFGNRRKYICRTWIRIVVWSSYLMADWIANATIGVISSNFSQSYSKHASLDSGIELTALWAPFLLLHLGGPDTITAYSFEDNELWPRHLLGLGLRAGAVLYILFLVWTDSLLSILSLMILFAGIIKYGERIWVCRSCSSAQLRNSMITPPDPGPNYAKFMQEYTLKELEGFHVVADELIEAQVPVNLSSSENNPIRDAKELMAAHDLLKSFKRLLVDLILGFDDRQNSQSLFKEISHTEAFKVVEIELGFIYDMLYTKASLNYSHKGFVLRFITVLLTSTVLVVFSATISLGDKYARTDLY